MTHICYIRNAMFDMMSTILIESRTVNMGVNMDQSRPACCQVYRMEHTCLSGHLVDGLPSAEVTDVGMKLRSRFSLHDLLGLLQTLHRNVTPYHHRTKFCELGRQPLTWSKQISLRSGMLLDITCQQNSLSKCQSSKLE